MKGWVSAILLACVVALVAFYAGRRTKPEPENLHFHPATLESAVHLDIVPLADGGTYAHGVASGEVWYVRGGRGVRVQGLPEKEIVFDLIPTADGGAYVHISGKGLWYIKEGFARKVEETEAGSSQTFEAHPVNSWLWALLQRERHQHKQLEEESEECRSEDEG